MLRDLLGNTMNKKAIAILGAIFLLIVATLGFLIFMRSDDTATDTPPVTENPSTENPVTENPDEAQPVYNLTLDQVISPTLFFNGTGVTYFNSQGQLYQADLVPDSGGKLTFVQPRSLEIETRPGITRILWPQDGPDFIAETTNGTQKAWSYYRYSTGTYMDYPANIVSVDWMPDGQRIVYVWLENGKATLNVSDADLQNWQQVAEMWELDDTVYVSPDGQSVIYHQTGNASSTNPVYLTTPDGKLWKTPVPDGYNSGVQWSPDSQKFLFGRKEVNSGSYQLWYHNMVTGETKNTGLFTTPDKAVWSSDSKLVYAAAPSGSEAMEVFYEIFTTTPNLDRQEHGTGFITVVDAKDLFLNQEGDKLLFKNGQDNGLYYLDLSK